MRRRGSRARDRARGDRRGHGLDANGDGAMGGHDRLLHRQARWWRRREWPAFATRWERSHEVSKDALPSCGSALIAELASHPGLFMSLKIGRNIAAAIVRGCPTSRVSRAARSRPKDHVFMLTICRGSSRTRGRDGHGTSRPEIRTSLNAHRDLAPPLRRWITRKRPVPS